MNTILNKCLQKFVLVFLDDIFIYSHDWEAHLQQVWVILNILRKNHLVVEIEKCSFSKKQVHHSGHIIGEDGVKVNPDKIKAMKSWPTPTNVKEL